MNQETLAQEAESEIRHHLPNREYPTYYHETHMIEMFISGANFIINGELAEAMKEAARYKCLFELAKQFKAKAEAVAFKNHVAAQNIESEKDMNSILTDELAAMRDALEKIADITLDCHTVVEVAQIRELALNALK